jgi:alpha-beta hydrolase superfamily lysophospholipase
VSSETKIITNANTTYNQAKTRMRASATVSSIPAAVADYRSHMQSMTVEGNQLAYVDAGPRDGQVVLLLHGLPTPSWLYRKIYPALASAGLRVIVPDLIGFGASDKPDDLAAYFPDKQAAYILALMRGLGIDH